MKQRYKGRKHVEEDVSSYWMTFSQIEDTGNLNRIL
jgi:hypothetical protein